MAEEKARILKVLEALARCVDPARPTDIGAVIRETPFFAGHDLSELESKGLAQKPDKKKNLYLITDEGRQTLENPPDNWLYKPSRETPPQETPPGSPPQETTVPSQSDLFRDIGERLRIGIGRSGKQEGTPLDAIIYYAQRTADFDNLISVWEGTVSVISSVISSVLLFSASLKLLSLNFFRWILQVVHTFVGYFVKWLFLSEFPH